MQEGEVRLGVILDFWKHRDCAEKIALASDKVIFLESWVPCCRAAALACLA